MPNIRRSSDLGGCDEMDQDLGESLLQARGAWSCSALRHVLSTTGATVTRVAPCPPQDPGPRQTAAAGTSLSLSARSVPPDPTLRTCTGLLDYPLTHDPEGPTLCCYKRRIGLPLPRKQPAHMAGHVLSLPPTCVLWLLAGLGISATGWDLAADAAALGRSTARPAPPRSTLVRRCLHLL